MKRIEFVIPAAGVLLCAVFLFLGCAEKSGKTETVLYEKVRKQAFVLTQCDVFDSLSLEDKILAYHLTQAAICADPIIYKQIHPQGYLIKLILDGIMAHSEGLKQHLKVGSEEYAKLFWRNHGIYDRASGEKIIPRLDLRGLQEATVLALSNGARIGFRLHKDIKLILEGLQPTLFDSLYKPFLSVKLHTTGISGLYSGGEWSELGDFKECFPLNSQLVKTELGWKEEIYRAGNDSIKPGLYAEELTNTVDNLRLCKAYIDNKGNELIDLLSSYLETGNPQIFERYLYEWVRFNSEVDWFIGFMPADFDIRQVKGSYRGLVFIRDEQGCEWIDNLVNIAPEIERKAEWIPFSGNDSLNCLVLSAYLLSAAGDAGYMTPKVVNFSSNGNSKTIIFKNIISARHDLGAKRNLLLAGSEGEKAAWQKYADEIEWVYLTVKEVLGRRSERKISCGWTGVRQKSDANYFLLKECIASSAALWFIGLPCMADKGIISSAEEALALYQWWVRETLVNEAAMDEIPWSVNCPQKLADRIILQYILQNSDCITRTNINGNTCFLLNDAEQFHEAAGELFRTLSNIGLKGEWVSFDNMIQKYDAPFTEDLASEISHRFAQNRIPQGIAVITPLLYLRTTPMGKIKNVELNYPKSVIEYGVEIGERSRIITLPPMEK